MLNKSSGIILILFLVIACSSFMTDKDADQLIAHGEKEYILKKDILESGKIVLKKNTRVKLIVLPQGNWIKVYAYPAEQKNLDSKRTNILYIFNEEFPLELYDYNFFNRKLIKIVKPINNK